MAGFNKAKLVSFLKKNEDAGQSAAAKELGITIGQLPMIEFCKAQVEAGVHGKLPATERGVKQGRDQQGNRWELIAARTGLGVAEVKRLYGGETARVAKPKGKAAATASKSKKPSGRAAGRKPAKGSAGPQRARTRAQRLARAGDPS